MSQEIATRHPVYLRNIVTWKKMRHCVVGEAAVKMHNELYLPIPQSMLVDPAAPSVQATGGTTTVPDYAGRWGLDASDIRYDPNYHQIPAYRAYKTRCQFPDIVAHTLRGLMGLCSETMPLIELPSGMEYLLETATKDGKTLEELYFETLANVLATGRHLLLPDVREDNTMYISPYVTETLINWGPSKKRVVFGVFEEQKPSGSTKYDHDTEAQYREVSIDDAGVYAQTVYDKDGQVVETTNPSVMGQTLDFVPLVCAGSTDISFDVDVIPLVGIADCALQIYRKDADLSQNEYMSCNPTLTVTGAEEDEVPKVIGSTVVWALGNPQARVTYTQTDTGALGHMEERIEGLYERAAEYGSQLLGPSKAGVEAADTMRIRQASSGATLASVVETVSAAFQQCLQNMATWSDNDPDAVLFEGNKDFADIKLTQPELTALMQKWMNGAISYETLFWNLQRSGIVPEERTMEEELAFIESRVASTPTIPAVGPPSQEEEEEEADGT